MDGRAEILCHILVIPRSLMLLTDEHFYSNARGIGRKGLDTGPRVRPQIQPGQPGQPGQTARQRQTAHPSLPVPLLARTLCLPPAPRTCNPPAVRVEFYSCSLVFSLHTKTADSSGQSPTLDSLTTLVLGHSHLSTATPKNPYI
jgi:hypothetical protein